MQTPEGSLFVVVGADGSASSEAALTWGVEAALRRSLPLRVVHVEAAGPDAGTRGRDLVDALLRRAAQAQVRAEGVVQPGDPVRVLIDQAGSAALVVVGAIGKSGPRHLRLGSVADHLIQQARCPVVVTPEAPNPAADHRVVVGLDGTGGSEHALTFAFEEASLRGVSLTIVIARAEADDSGADAKVELGATDARFGAYDLTVLRKAHPIVRVSGEIRAGNPVQLLLEHARDAELLVVGARAHAGLPGLDHASVSHAVILHASCPVAVVRD
jgi:nucleotide-binding universal stress UspA family protein